MSIQILSPGPLTTVQDLGRHGYMKDGFSPSGAMDTRAAVIANLLVGNDKNDAVLEMTLMGIGARVLDRTVVAFAGGNFSPKINGAAVPMMQAIAVFPGDEIAMGFAASGCRAYMAVRGGIDVPLVMGSRSTNLKAHVGGFEGRKLMAGDILPIFPASPLSEGETARRRLPYAPYFENGMLSVRAVPGPEDDRFPEQTLSAFFSEEYTVTPASDRMGMRLDGTPLASKNGVDIVSGGIAMGSVQIPPNGKPIVLLADRQTVGGYAKLATVITADIPLLAQAKPGDRVRFVRCTLDAAQRAAREEQKRLAGIRFR